LGGEGVGKKKQLRKISKKKGKDGGKPRKEELESEGLQLSVKGKVPGGRSTGESQTDRCKKFCGRRGKRPKRTRGEEEKRSNT